MKMCFLVSCSWQYPKWTSISWNKAPNVKCWDWLMVMSGWKWQRDQEEK